MVLAQRRWLCDTLAARGVTANSVIVGDDDNLDIAHKYGFPTVEMDNEYVGRKFNAGYKYAAEQGADVFVHIGSDDWVHPDAFNFLLKRDPNRLANDRLHPPGGSVVWKPGPTIVAQREVALVDLVSGDAVFCHIRGRCGCIPWFLPRIALEGCDFTPIQDDIQRGIDGSLIRGIQSVHPNWRFQEDASPLWMVDFKSATNITPFAGLTHLSSERVNAWAVLAGGYPQEIVDRAEAVHARRAEWGLQ